MTVIFKLPKIPSLSKIFGPIGKGTKEHKLGLLDGYNGDVELNIELPISAPSEDKYKPDIYSTVEYKVPRQAALTSLKTPEDHTEILRILPSGGGEVMWDSA